jgi:hypothetical protein
MIKKSNSFGANPFIFGKLLGGSKKNTSGSEVVVLGRKRVQLLIQAYCNGLVNVFVLGLAGNWKN